MYYVYVICIMYMHYVYVLCICICILYSVYVLCNVNKKRGNNIFNNNNGVLVARGGRENSNPAKTTTHSGTVEKETHFINVVGKSSEVG